MLLDANLDYELQTILLLNLYACYTARNALKHHHAPHLCNNVGDCMLQCAKQGTFGHGASRGILQKWISNQTVHGLVEI